MTQAAPLGLLRILLDHPGERLVPLILETLRSPEAATLRRNQDAWLAGLQAALPAAPGKQEAVASMRARFTRRELEILELIAAGKSNKEVAQVLEIAPETVKTYLKRLFAKLEVERRAHAVARAQALGLIGAR